MASAQVTQKFNILPTPHTDSVMAVLADEMGLLGLLVTIALFGLFTWRGFVVAQRATTPFGAFMAIGITVWVAIQTLMNLLSVLSMIPFTGVPVPFLSVGGSSLVSLLIRLRRIGVDLARKPGRSRYR